MAHRVALIQSQSEMAHYGYADATPLLAHHDYDVTLFTAHNSDQLATRIAGEFDAIILASNALNDKEIRRNFEDRRTRTAVGEFLRKGGGLLALHQLGVANSPAPVLDLCPGELPAIKLVVRNSAERFVSGKLAIPRATANHTLLAYPNVIDPGEVQHAAVQFRSLRGLYWQYFEEISPAHWDSLVVDSDPTESRPLIFATKQSSSIRIVVSSLALDWQRHRPLFENLVTYIVEGKHNTALLSDGNRPSVSFGYLVASLRSRRFPFRHYQTSRDPAGSTMDDLRRCIDNGVHAILLLAPYVQESGLNEQLRDSIRSGVSEGRLRVITMATGESPSRMGGMYSVRSRHHHARRLLQYMELSVNDDLRRGYVDDSFWKTIDTLQCLEAMPGQQVGYRDAVGPAMDRLNSRDRQGSYDEVFGATCAVFWFRSTYLGNENGRTKETLRWIRRALGNHEAREKALAYTMFSLRGVITTSEREDLLQILSTQDSQRLSQTDLINFLRAAIAVGATRSIARMTTRLIQEIDTDGWLDLVTAADGAYLLVEVQSLISESAQLLTPQLSEQIDTLIFKVIIDIKDSLDRTISSGYVGPYPWDREASTSAKCLLAWLKFDERLDLPIYDLMESLDQHSRAATQYASGRISLAVLDELKHDNDRLLEQREALTKRFGSVAHVWKTRQLLLALSALLVYVIALLIYGSTIDDGSRLTQIATRAFVETWPFTTFIVPLIVGLLAVPWARILIRSSGPSTSGNDADE